jgi:hypothetical protein
MSNRKPSVTVNDSTPQYSQPQFDFTPYREIPLTQGLVALVDAADYEWLIQWKWYAQKTISTWYAARNSSRGGTRIFVLMHRAIMLPEPDQLIDHRDMNGLNNTRANLRFATKHENMRHTGLTTRNTSGYKGVSWSKKGNRWFATIQINSKTKFLGNYLTPEEAARAYDVAAKEAFGEFAWLNFP